MQMEFGQVVLLGSDGSEGQALNIRKDVTFGCCSPAHIRIKSKSVGREHALIHVDTNGICTFHCLDTSSSRPRINGIRMRSQRHGTNSKETSCVTPLHHMDVITIAGRSFLFKSKSGLTMEQYNSRLETEVVAMAMAVSKKDKECSGAGEGEDEVDTMSLDSRSSRWSTCSQVSTTSSAGLSINSAHTNNSVTRSHRNVEIPFAGLYLLKKDGTEGSPYTVVKEVTFGR